jgi:transcription antitermination factor NusG
MASARTLTVVASLTAAGFDVWAPTGMIRRKIPRSHKYRDLEVAMLPALAFANAAHIDELLAVIHSPVRVHPAFTLLQRGESVLTAANNQLQPLRDFEAKHNEDWQAFLETEAREARRKSKKSRARAYVMGQRVRVDVPSFAGLIGEIVEIRKNGDLVLEFTGFLRGTVVPSCDVVSIQLSGALSEQDKAA